MIGTAEKAAAEAGIDRAAQDEVALLRYEQYGRALADDRAFSFGFDARDTANRRVSNASTTS